MSDTAYMILFFGLCPAIWVLCFVLDRIWPCEPGAGPRTHAYNAYYTAPAQSWQQTLSGAAYS